MALGNRIAILFIVCNRCARYQNKPRAWENRVFKFVPAVNKVKVYADLEIPASFVRVIKDVYDDGHVRKYILQITKDGLEAGLPSVIKDLGEKENIKFEVVPGEDSVMLMNAAISSENNASKTVVIGRVVSVFTPATYRKLQ